MLQYVRLFVVNMLFRQKKVLLVCFLMICLTLHISYRNRPARIEPHPSKRVDLVKRRSTYINPVYYKIESLPSIPEKSQERCSLYFEELRALYPGVPGPDIIDLEFIKAFDFDKNIYREKTWLRFAKKNLKKQLRKKNQRYSSSNDEVLQKRYQEEVSALADYERRVTHEFNHKRVFGKCYLSNDEALDGSQDSICAEYQRKLYPWLSTDKYPVFENWRKDRLQKGEVPIFTTVSKDETQKDPKCLLSLWKKKSNGKGIVIPVLPGSVKEKQLTRIRNLIKVIRLSKNHLPIQIVYMDGRLSAEDKKVLVKEARTEKGSLPESYDDYLRSIEDLHPFKASLDYPKQDLWFVDVSNMLNTNQHPLIPRSYQFHGPNFLLSLATIFNSFEEFVIMGERAIPLVDDLATNLLQNENYKKYGQLFFKNPLRQKAARRRIKPGFSDVNDFVKGYFMPNNFDKDFFSMHKRKGKSDSKLVFDEGLQEILDVNMMVINKKRHLSGLMLSCNLQLYKLMEARFNIVRGEVLGDFIWLGMEISGVNKEVYFNRYFGAAVGVLTPPENKPFDKLTTSSELCSSSWGQISDVDDFTLLYVTSHQLENYLDHPAFREDLAKKFTIKKKVNKDDYDKLVHLKEEEDKESTPGSSVKLSPEEMLELEELAFERRYKALKEGVAKPQQTEAANPLLKRDLPEDTEEKSQKDDELQLPPLQDSPPPDPFEQVPIPQPPPPAPQENLERSDEQNIDSQNTEKQEPEKQDAGSGTPDTALPEVVEIDDTDLYDKTVAKNPLYIRTSLRPPNFLQPVFEEGHKEPRLGWLHVDEFAGYKGHKYWCAYDIVGSPFSGQRGIIDDYGTVLQAKYRSMLDVWAS